MTVTLDRAVPLVPEIVDDVTRREFIVAGISLAALLAGCGGDDRPDAASASRTLQGDNGTVTVPAAPERVGCVIGSFDIDVLAVGITPVITTYFAEGWADVPAPTIVSRNVPPTVEELAKARPDVMLGWNWVTAEPYYDDLVKIAPYVGLGEAEGVAWRETFLQTCDVVNRRGRAEQLLVEFDERVERLAARRAGEPPLRVARIEFYEPGSFSFRGQDEVSAELMRAIGLTVVGPDKREDRSLERLPEIDADVLVVPAGSDNIPMSLLDDVRGTEVWQRVPAVAAGRVHIVDAGLWPGAGYLFATRLLDDLERLFVA